MMLTLGYGGAKKRRVVVQELKEEVKEEVKDEMNGGEGTAYDEEELVTSGDACLDDIEVDIETIVVEGNRNGEVEAAVVKEKSEEEDDDDEEKEEGEEEIAAEVDFTLLSEDELGLTDHEDQPMDEFTKPMDHSSVACHLCKKTFNGTIGLKRHIGHMHKDGKLRKTKRVVKAKAKEFVGKPIEEKYKNFPPFICNVCNVEFQGSIVLSSHIAKEHPQAKKLGKNGDEQMQTESRKENDVDGNGMDSEVGEHSLVVNDGILPFQCADCYKQFKSKLSLQQHKKIKHSQQNLTCDMCDYCTSLRSDLKHHKQSKHTDEKFPCQLCSHTSDTKPGLKYHNMKQHSKTINEDENLEVCDVCTQRFKSTHGLKLHKRRAHYTELKFEDTKNAFLLDMEDMSKKDENLAVKAEQMEFKDMATDAEELETQQKYGAPDVKIEDLMVNVAEVRSEELLDFTLLSEDELSLSVGDESMDRVSNPVDTSNVCIICDKNFNGMIGLKKHIGHMHKTDRPHRITKFQNGKTKVTIGNKPLEADYEKNESCNFCNEEFQDTCVLKSHIAKEHPQTNASVADQKAAFTLCVLCSATFNSRVELRKHKKNEHRDQEFPCSQCKWSGDTPNSLQIHRNSVCRAQGVF